MKNMTMNLQQCFGVNMSKKNVILILTDQMRGDCIGVNGNEQIMTPFLDDLANSGLNYTNGQCTNPSCIPARANILTGLPAHKNGFFGYCDGIPWEYENTLVDELNERGYKTINVGKTHFYPQNNAMNFNVNKLYDPQRIDDGFESDYHKWLRNNKPTIDDPAIVTDNNGWPFFEWPGQSYYHPTEWTCRTAIEQIEENKEQPFFMQISFHRPHPPLDPPKFYYDLYNDIDLGERVVGEWSKAHEKYIPEVHGQYGRIDDKYYKLMKQAYYGLITHIDYQVGKIIQALRHNKKIDDTLIIFTSDHGEMLGDHHMFRKATPFRGSIHIPLIINGPGIQNGTCDDIVTHIDLKPTILNYIDGHKQAYDGIDMLTQTRDYLIGEHPFDRGWHFCITANYKYIWDSVSGDEWCFDIKQDVLETTNIVHKIAKSELIKLRKLLIDSFKKRELYQFVEGDTLKIGSKLPAYEKRESEKHG